MNIKLIGVDKMFLIEYKNGQFINAEDIQWIKVSKGKISFTVKSLPEDLFEVDGKYQENFVNNLQALNQNIHNVESKYDELNKAT